MPGDAMIAKQPTKKRKRRPVPRGAFRRATLAEYLDIGLDSLDNLCARRQIPPGVFLNGCKVWRKKTIDLWMAWGFCDARAFEALLAAARARRRK